MDTQLPPRLLLTIPEAAQLLGVGRSKFYELVTEGRIETVKLGRCARVPLDALEEFVRSLRMSHRRGTMEPSPRSAGDELEPSGHPLVTLFDEGTWS